MKIIQSFALFDEGNPRLHYDINKNKELLNFYSFLLSYLTLNKYYGKVTMYCNEKAQNSLIKYIPYDEVKIVENRNSMKFWSYYKVDIMKRMRQDFIHVDSDVFIFDDLFSEFINNENLDIIIQNIIPEESNYVNKYVDMFREFIIENDIINPEKYDGRCHSCGTIGMRIKHKKGYIELCEKMRKGFIDGDTKDVWFIGMASEELAMYLFSINNNLNVHEILPYVDIVKYGEKGAGNYHDYTHMYLDSKFQPKYVKLIRRKIIKEFPEHTITIQKYEDEIMNGSELLDEII